MKTLLKLILLPLFLFSEEYLEFNFSTGIEGWSVDFADYPLSSESFYELGWGWENLPLPVEGHSTLLTKGIYLTGNNHSDDLFMFARKEITHLKPNTLYSLQFSLLIENNVPPGSAGIGGSPGEGVYFKVGASSFKPEKVNVSGFYHLNVDKGEQSQGGTHALVIGDLANPLVNPLDPTFQPKRMTEETRLHMRSDEKGSLWIFVGTDSGFEGVTKYYLAEIGVGLSEEDDL